MELDQRQAKTAAFVTFGALAALLLTRLAAFGIWDPWELNVADGARQLMEGQEVTLTQAPLTTWLIKLSFGAFGVDEFFGRLPIAIGGLVAIGSAFFITKRVSPRAGIYAMVVAATSPLFLFNARQMLGDGLAMGATGLVGLTAAGLAFERQDDTKRALLWLGGLVAAIAIASLAGGALATVVPPLLAVAVVAGLRADAVESQAAKLRLYGTIGMATLVTLGVARAIVADAAGMSLWLGGAPMGGDPPTFDAAIEVVFHGLAPWSALILIACAHSISPDATSIKPTKDEDEATKPAFDERGLRLALVLWMALGYGALTLYTARYGSTTFLPIVAAGALIGSLLDDIERSGRPWWAEGIVGALFVGLILRDYALYPESPARALPIENLEVPEIFNPRKAWAGVCALFVSMLVLSFGATGTKKPDPKAPILFLREHWKKGGVFRFWVGAALALALALIVTGLMFTAMKDTAVSEWGLPSIVPRIFQRAMLLPFAALAAAVIVPMVFYFYGEKLARFRMLPLLGAALVFGAYSSLSFQPALSAHFSPREVYDTYNELRGEGAPLAEFHVSGRAGAYYAETDDGIEQIANLAELTEWLDQPGQRFVVIPFDELPEVNRWYRRNKNRHAYIADGRSARVLLLASEEIDGRENENYIAQNVLTEVPEVQHPVGGMFEGKVELIGYDLELPQDGYVGAGQDFVVTWYWRVLRRPGNHRIFVHIDGAGNRLNGDHDPVDGRYPVNLWDEGDIVVDRQEFTVPANYRSGDYSLLIGFFAGSRRLRVEGDRNDGANRLRAGSLTIR